MVRVYADRNENGNGAVAVLGEGEPMNDDLISRAAAIESIRECAEVAHSNYEWDMEQGYLNAIECIEEEPSAQPEHMHTVMLKIKEKYEKAMNTPCINNPIAWALYQTWKEYDR